MQEAGRSLKAFNDSPGEFICRPANTPLIEGEIMKKKLSILASLATLFAGPSAFAINAGSRTIEQIGCHTDGNLCFVLVSGNPAGSPSCFGTTFAWDSKSVNGREVLSLLTAAFHSGKTVRFELGAGCSPLQVDLPTIMWINVEK